jgi:hypothetical protein
VSEFDKLKLAIDDIRARHKALYDLIIFTDQQAMGYLRLYVTLGLATASGAVSGIVGSASISHALGWGLVGATICLLVGSFYCFKAMNTANIGLIGRGPEFWEWAFLGGVEDRHIIDRYLKGAEAGIAINRELNKTTTGCLQKGRRLGAWAPIATLVAGLIAYGVTNP